MRLRMGCRTSADRIGLDCRIIIHKTLSQTEAKVESTETFFDGKTMNMGRVRSK